MTFTINIDFETKVYTVDGVSDVSFGNVSGGGGGGAVDSVFGRTGAVTAQSGDYTTAQVTESGNLYFTVARAIAATLTGFVVAGTNAAIDASDSILNAFQKVQKQLNDIVTTFSNYYTSSQTDTLLSAKEDVSNKQTDLTASATKYPTVNAVNTGLATKQDTLTADNVGTFIDSLSTKTTLVNNDSFLIKDSAATNDAKEVLYSDLKTQLHTDLEDHYTTIAVAASANPADATTYYFGSTYSLPINTNAGVRRIYFTQTGTVERVAIYLRCSAGSNEQSTIYVRLNNTDDYPISSTVDCSVSDQCILNTNMAVPVTQGVDYVEIKWVTPTWSANPTQVVFHALIMVRV